MRQRIGAVTAGKTNVRPLFGRHLPQLFLRPEAGIGIQQPANKTGDRRCMRGRGDCLMMGLGKHSSVLRLVLNLPPL